MRISSRKNANQRSKSLKLVLATGFSGCVFLLLLSWWQAPWRNGPLPVDIGQHFALVKKRLDVPNASIYESKDWDDTFFLVQLDSKEFKIANLSVCPPDCSYETGPLDTLPLKDLQYFKFIAPEELAKTIKLKGHNFQTKFLRANNTFIDDESTVSLMATDLNDDGHLDMVLDHVYQRYGRDESTAESVCGYEIVNGRPRYFWSYYMEKSTYTPLSLTTLKIQRNGATDISVLYPNYSQPKAMSGYVHIYYDAATKSYQSEGWTFWRTLSVLWLSFAALIEWLFQYFLYFVLAFLCLFIIFVICGVLQHSAKPNNTSTKTTKDKDKTALV